jgi:hypothetical protein
MFNRGYRRTLDCGAVDRRANGVRGLGGMAQPNRRTVAHRIARLFGFQDSDAMTIDVVIGTAVTALAAFEAWIAYAGEGVPKSVSH